MTVFVLKSRPHKSTQHVAKSRNCCFMYLFHSKKGHGLSLIMVQWKIQTNFKRKSLCRDPSVDEWLPKGISDLRKKIKTILKNPVFERLLDIFFCRKSILYHCYFPCFFSGKTLKTCLNIFDDFPIFFPNFFFQEDVTAPRSRKLGHRGGLGENIHNPGLLEFNGMVSGDGFQRQ